MGLGLTVSDVELEVQGRGWVLGKGFRAYDLGLGVLGLGGRV